MTKMEPCALGDRALADLVPIELNRVFGVAGNLTQHEVEIGDAVRLSLCSLLEGLDPGWLGWRIVHASSDATLGHCRHFTGAGSDAQVIGKEADAPSVSADRAVISRGGAPVSRLKCLRSVCKPHSVQRVAQVYATRASSLPSRFSDHLSMQSTRELRAERAAPSSLFDLAPDGGYLAAHIAANAGGLLHRLFTMTAVNSEGAQCGCCFLWPNPTDYSVPGFPRRRALRSTDFPRPPKREPRSPNRPEASSSYTRGQGASTVPVRSGLRTLCEWAWRDPYGERESPEHARLQGL